MDFGGCVSPVNVVPCGPVVSPVSVGPCGPGVGGMFTTTGVILVLFILLVIILRATHC